jgi:hypothetical protein
MQSASYGSLPEGLAIKVNSGLPVNGIDGSMERGLF